MPASVSPGNKRSMQRRQYPMKFRNLIVAAALAALPFSAQAATLIVPAAGTGPGANASQWQSELTLHSAAPRPMTLSVSFHRGTDVLGPVAITLQARETTSIADIAHTQFGLASGKIGRAHV